MDEVKNVLDEFAAKVVHGAKLGLFPGALKNSIRYDLDVFPNSFGLSFFMNTYGLFQDEGVDGKFIKYGSKYSYKNVHNPSVKFSNSMGNWAKKKGIRFRGADGTFAKGNYKSIGFVFARAKQKYGTKPTRFFSKPFNIAFADLPDDVVEAYGLELDKTFKQWLEKPNLI